MLLTVQEGVEYLFTVAGPSKKAAPGDFGLAFDYRFQLNLPPFTEPVIELLHPEGDLEVFPGTAVRLSAKIVNEPPAFAGLEFTGIVGNSPPPSHPGTFFETNWVFPTPGTFQVGAVARRKDGSTAASTVTRIIRVVNPVPPYDRFDDRSELSGLTTTAVIEAGMAGLEPLERSITGEASARSVWWRWQAPATGELEVSASWQNAALGFLAVYSGTDLPTLRPVLGWESWTPGTPVNGNFNTRSLRTPVAAGTDYAIVYEEFGWNSEEALLRLRLRPIPPNDSWSAALPLSGQGAAEEASNVGATRELGEPAHAEVFGGRSVWYRWQAPANGQLAVNLEGTLAAPLIAVYTGTAPSSLTLVTALASATNSATLEFRTGSGIDYHIAVDGAMGTTGDFVVRLAWVPDPAELHLTSLSVDDSFGTIEVAGAAGREVTILSSPDLADWKAVGAAWPALDGVARFRIPLDDSGSFQFFRASVPP